jgi:hypothetical protein|tara:strand:- start:435 stop:542 length:108 start_codon:yes stop_codon:yes gene_type:complete
MGKKDKKIEEKKPISSIDKKINKLQSLIVKLQAQK